jgi:hypothetical protein
MADDKPETPDEPVIPGEITDMVEKHVRAVLNERTDTPTEGAKRPDPPPPPPEAPLPPKDVGPVHEVGALSMAEKMKRARKELKARPETQPYENFYLGWTLDSLDKLQDLEPDQVKRLLELAVDDVTAASKELVSAYGGGKGAWGEADAQIAAAGDKTEAAARRAADALELVQEIAVKVAKVGLPVLLALLGL